MQTNEADYLVEADVFYWSAAKQTGGDGYQGIAHLTMKDEAGDLLPELSLILPTIQRTMSAAMSEANDYSVLLARTGTVRLLVQSGAGMRHVPLDEYHTAAS